MTSPPTSPSPTSSNVDRFAVYRCPVTGKFHDPFKTLRHLAHYAGGSAKLNELVEKQDDPVVAGQLVAAGRRAFGLDEIDPASGAGIPDLAVLSVLEAFSEYVEGKGWRGGSWRTYVRCVRSPSPRKTCSP